MRALVAVGVALTCGTALAAGGTTSLHVVYSPVPSAPARMLTLRCNPPAGSVARPAAACRRLATLGRAAFAPTPAGTACTQIYGGPQVAVVTGTLGGQRLWARFTRRDGCEVARWSRISFLFVRS